MTDINEEIQKIWEHEKRTDIPLQFPQFKTNPEILFIGINPSIRGKEPKNHYESLEFEKNARSNKTDIYFKIFDNFVNRDKWEHIDLFFIRGKQKEIEEDIGFDYENDTDIISLNEFGEKQLNLSLSIIEQINPKIIVVNNALASRIIRERLDIGEIDIDKGYHKLNSTTPIFFSGMLSGQRALDKHSRERLIWHVKRTLSSI
jgi:hypothetical protein